MAVAFESDRYNIEDQVTYHETPYFAADFSAFYNGAWAFFNNSSQVYGPANNPVPHGQTFLYPPPFLVFVIPLLAYPFPTAEFIFSAAQFALLPLVAVLVYLIFRPRRQVEYLLAAGVTEMTLLEPFDSRYVGLALGPQLQQFLPVLLVLPLIPYLACEVVWSSSRRVSLLCLAILLGMVTWLVFGTQGGGFANYVILSMPYGTQWQLGQSKVLQLTLILLALWLAVKKPVLSAPVLLLSVFDPRFTLLALPMYLYIIIKNRHVVRMLEGSAIAVLVLVVPFLFYHDIYGQYVSFILGHYSLNAASSKRDPFEFFDYDWLVIYSLVVAQVGFAVTEFLRLGGIERVFGRRSRSKVERGAALAGGLVQDEKEGGRDEEDATHPSPPDQLKRTFDDPTGLSSTSEPRQARRRTPRGVWLRLRESVQYVR
jgi:hypothetical protein